MGRAKQRLELIAKEKTRNTTYRNRKHGIIKKAKELAILCDIDVAVIMYPPNSDDPEIWPPGNLDQVKNSIDTYKRKKSEIGTRSYDLNDFFEDRKKNIEAELVKARKTNMEAKYPTWFHELNVSTEAQLRQFITGLEKKANIARAHREMKKRKIHMQLPSRFEASSSIPYTGGLHPLQSLDQVQGVNQGPGWFHDAPMTTFIPSNQILDGFGTYPLPEGGPFYPNSNPTWLCEFKKRNIHMRLKSRFEPRSVHDAGGPHPHTSDDQVQVVNHGLGWFHDGSMTPFIPLNHKLDGIGIYAQSEGGMVYPSSNPTWMCQPPMVHNGPKQESAVKQVEPQVKNCENDDFLDFVIDDVVLEFPFPDVDLGVSRDGCGDGPK